MAILPQHARKIIQRIAEAIGVKPGTPIERLVLVFDVKQVVKAYVKVHVNKDDVEQVPALLTKLIEEWPQQVQTIPVADVMVDEQTHEVYHRK